MSNDTVDDTFAVDAITIALSGKTWSSDTLEKIAHIVRLTGRTIRDVDGES